MEQLYNILSEFERNPETYIAVGLVSLSVALGIVNYCHNRKYRIREQSKLEKMMEDKKIE